MHMVYEMKTIMPLFIFILVLLFYMVDLDEKPKTLNQMAYLD